jgi:hypothetical protein
VVIEVTVAARLMSAVRSPVTVDGGDARGEFREARR